MSPADAGTDDRERGSAVVDFVLVGVLVVALLLAVLQVAVYVHLRNVVVASAQQGARYAANADVREAGKRRLLEAGGRKEIAMMVPVVFLVLPVTVLFALYPGLISIVSLAQ